MRRRITIFVGQKGPSEHRLDAKDWEETCGDGSSIQESRFATAGQSVVEGAVRRQVCEYLVSLLKVQKVCGRKCIPTSLVIRIFAFKNAD